MTSTRQLPSNLVLQSGAHRSIAQGGCALEWVAFLAGEKHSDAAAAAADARSARLAGWERAAAFVDRLLAVTASVTVNVRE